MKTEEIIKLATVEIFKKEFDADITSEMVTYGITKKEFEGDYTIVIFPLIRASKKSPEQTAEILGNALKEKLDFVAAFNVLKGFLNLSFTSNYWKNYLAEIDTQSTASFAKNRSGKVLLEYCSPNTNKPLHIGHVRNMLLGFSMSEILKAVGYDVTKVSIYNDRGIAICKSMAAYLREGNGATPDSTGIKGDHLVGDYYVRYNEIAKEELLEMVGLGNNSDSNKIEPNHKFEAGNEVSFEDDSNTEFVNKNKTTEEQENTNIAKSARELLRKWEAGDNATIQLWKQMNEWVYAGYEETFQLMKVDFDKDYFESETYSLGKDIVEEGLAKNVFFKRADGAIAIDLTADGLDEKVLLRSDGTSIYITQDLGTAQMRYEEFGAEKTIYVVGNEQDYHFKVLKLILQKLGKTWADGIFHLSYAMVESPTGRFKSREGKTADADDLISEVMRIAAEKTKEHTRVEDFSEDELLQLYKTIGLGALKYFVLRVNPYKKIIFNPEESIDFHGHTGPFIQYTHARIKSIIRKAASELVPIEATSALSLHATEREIILQLSEFQNVLLAAADKYDPSELSSYLYTLAKLYNKFYSELPILKAASEEEKNIRIVLSKNVATVIEKGMKLLGIDVPERM